MKSLSFCIVVCLTLVEISSGTIINVPSQEVTIQAGINSAADGDTVLVAPGVYFENVDFDGHKITLASEFIISGDTSVISSTVIDGSSVGPVVAIDHRVDTLAWITGFTIQNGSQGGISCYSGFPTVEHNIVQNNQGRGIDIYGDSSGFAIIRNNKLISNSSTWEGGGLRYDGGDAPGIVTDNIFENNTAERGGGVYVRDEVYMARNIFRENSAERGGGLYCYYATVDLSDCVFDSNSATNGGGIHTHRSQITSTGMTISGHDAGGLTSSASHLMLTDCDFLNNGGFGIGSTESPLYLVDCFFSNNSEGGLVSYDTGFIHIENSVFENNSSTSYGGAITLWNYNDTTRAEIQNCRFSSNQAGAGGAIALKYAVIDLQDCLFDGNIATGYTHLYRPAGGAILAVGCSLKVENATIANNFVLPELPWPPSDGYGGGISLVQAQATISNSLFVGNSAPEGSAIDCYESQPALTCCDIYGNTEGDWTGCIADQLGVNGNFSADPLFCDTVAGDYHLNDSSPCTSANNDCSEPIGALDVGCIPTGVVDDYESELPFTFTLHQNYPNPFNPATTIEYNLPTKSHVVIDIFNVLGQKVRTLLDSNKPAGSYTVIWDGKDHSGRTVSTGIYLYRILTGEHEQTRKMLLLK